MAVSFLASSCGLSSHAARSIDKKIHSETVDNTLSVLALFKDYGFTEAQIVRIVDRHPHFLEIRAEKTLKPKLEFYRGISQVDDDITVPSLLATSPWPLMYSLEKRLLPNAEILRSILGTERNLVAALRHSPLLITNDLKTALLPKVETLRAYGASDEVISKLLTVHGNAFLFGRFEEALDAIKKMGISPLKLTFANAIGVYARMSKRVWDEKIDNLKRLGWSEDQIVVAFSRHPPVLGVSIENVRKRMEFVNEKLEWEPELTSKYPYILTMRLEERLLPRYAVLQVLMRKGFIKPGFTGNQFLASEEEFTRKFVTKYLQEAPEIVEAIKGFKVV